MTQQTTLKRVISLIAIFNGALVQVIMGSRVLYGMAEKGIAPKAFAGLNEVTRTPIVASLFFAAVLLLMALYFPITVLAKLTRFIILSIFGLISIGLCAIKVRDKTQACNALDHASENLHNIWTLIN